MPLKQRISSSRKRHGAEIVECGRLGLRVDVRSLVHDALLQGYSASVLGNAARREVYQDLDGRRASRPGRAAGIEPLERPSPVDDLGRIDPFRASVVSAVDLQ